MQLLLAELEGSQGRVLVLILERRWVKDRLNPVLVGVISLGHAPQLSDHVFPDVPCPGGIRLPALHRYHSGPFHELVLIEHLGLGLLCILVLLQ